MNWLSLASLPSFHSSLPSKQVHITMSVANYLGGDEATIEVGSTTWKSEGDYDEYGEPLCVCCPGPEADPSPMNPMDFIPMDEPVDEPSLDDRIRLYEEEREARHIVYAKWCLDAFIELASYSLHTDEEGRSAFRRLPNYEIVTATVNDLIARDFQGTGEPPRML